MALDLPGISNIGSCRQLTVTVLLDSDWYLWGTRLCIFNTWSIFFVLVKEYKVVSKVLVYSLSLTLDLPKNSLSNWTLLYIRGNNKLCPLDLKSATPVARPQPMDLHPLGGPT